MDWITNSKIFKGSKYQERILAAINDPINKPLLKQLTSYVGQDYDEDSIDDSIASTPSQFSEDKTAPADSKKGKSLNSTPHITPSNKSTAQFGGPSNNYSQDEDTDNIDDRDSQAVEFDEAKDEDDFAPPKEPSQGNVKESTCAEKSNINASTYVSVEVVSQAVSEIPGTLNLRSETKGVTYAALKGGSSTELWIYFENSVDINGVLDSVNSTLMNAGYYFLEFNRVARDENAIVFSINWISNYFNPLNLTGEKDEKQKQ